MAVKTVAPQFRGIPALKTDGDRPLIARCKLERRIVWNLIKHVTANGFVVHSVFDGEEYPKTPTALEAMEAVFSVDDATLRFTHPNLPKGRLMGVLLIGGNGVDIVSDYTSTNDNDWNDVMDAFDTSVFE